MNEPITAGDRVYQGIRDMIVYGEVEPNDRLIQRDLAKRFGTSNIPVVEAIRRLERDGLVVNHAKWGAHVKEWTLADFEGIYLIRESLDGIAGRLFAERATKAEKLTLIEHARRHDAAILEKDVKTGDEANIALHLYVVKGAKSPALFQYAENSCVITTTSKNAAWRALPVEQLPGKVGGHDALIAALNSGNPDLAEQAAREHVRIAYRELLELINRKPRERATA